MGLGLDFGCTEVRDSETASPDLYKKLLRKSRRCGRTKQHYECEAQCDQSRAHSASALTI